MHVPIRLGVLLRIILIIKVGVTVLKEKRRVNAALIDADRVGPFAVNIVCVNIEILMCSVVGGDHIVSAVVIADSRSENTAGAVYFVKHYLIFSCKDIACLSPVHKVVALEKRNSGEVLERAAYHMIFALGIANAWVGIKAFYNRVCVFHSRDFLSYFVMVHYSIYLCNIQAQMFDSIKCIWYTILQIICLVVKKMSGIKDDIEKIISTVVSEVVKNSRLFDSQVYHDEPILKTARQLSNYVPDEIKKMRSLASSSYYLSENELFYRQGKLMESYEDDFEYHGTFSRYFPTYRSLDNHQINR